MKALIKVFLAIATLCYPFLVYWGAKSFSGDFFQGALVALACLYFVSARSGNKLSWVWVGVCLALSVWLLLRDDLLPARLYPVAISLGLCGLFCWSLFHPPTVIERIARLKDPELPVQAVAYTRQVTKVWIGFFIFNASVSAYSSVYLSNELWLLYNGFISYVLMGCLFAGEWLLRRQVRRQVQRSLHSDKSNSR